MKKVDLKSATVVIMAWENQFAAAGGVRAVTQEYAKHLISVERKTIVITPLHTGLKSPTGVINLLFTFWHYFNETLHRVEIFEAYWGKVRWIYIHSDAFFNAEGGRDRSNPYLYAFDAKEEELGKGSPRLVSDCLFFAALMPRVLVALGLKENLVLHLQDWETCAVALTVKDAVERKELDQAICSLALHNPYDASMKSPALGKDGWKLISKRNIPKIDEISMSENEAIDEIPTFLRRLLPLIDTTPTTVSREFAKDLINDPLQTKHLADHLQVHFKSRGVIGVDNGPFGQFADPFTKDAVKEAKAGKPDRIIREKQTLRKKMVKEMRNYKPKERWGDIDFDILTPEQSESPVFMCVGRLDEGQKGYDVLARAIGILLDQSFDGYFVLTPIVGNAPQAYVDDLQDLGIKYKGRVVVYPIRMQKGYMEIQAGSSFSLWPSMYEPFGGVSEFLLKGTPVVGRSTGGLRQQIVNFDKSTGKGNGILYETILPEPQTAILPGEDNEYNEWRLVQREKYPRDRMKYSIYVDQVNKLVIAIRKAVEILDAPKAHGKLLSNLYKSVSGYSWSRAEAEYFKNYSGVLEA